MEHHFAEPTASGKLLLVASNPSRLAERTASLSSRGLSLAAAADGVEAVQRLRTGGFDSVLVELPVPGWEDEELLEEMQRAASGTPVIVLEGAAAEPQDTLARVIGAVRMVKLGAFHYVPSEAGNAEISRAVDAALARTRGLRDDDPPDEPWRGLLVGESRPMRNVAETIRLIGARRCTVLITGETGTGKEMAARAIHLASNRSRMPLIAVNCSALPENLLEAELFGHVKGAFTGAVQSRVGRFEQADHGTLFLDEIGEMPLELQAKLLRVLQEKEFQRLGSSETVRVDVRIVAASNVDLVEKVRQGRFREDLYYRINVVPITMPPLRDRNGDLALLAQHFVAKICRQEEIPLKSIGPETLDRLRRYSWPGNVRQLENAVEMAVALSGDRRELHAGDFPLPSALETRKPAAGASLHITVPAEGLDFEETVGRIELSLLEQALRRTGGNKKLAADMLRLKRTTLAAKLKSLDGAVSRSAATALR